jgi:hypothetical protein
LYCHNRSLVLRVLQGRSWVTNRERERQLPGISSEISRETGEEARLRKKRATKIKREELKQE